MTAIRVQTSHMVRSRDLDQIERLFTNTVKDTDFEGGWVGHGLLVKINGQWREVYDVWTSENWEAAIETFGENSRYGKQIQDKCDTASSIWVAVRYLVEEKSTQSELEDALAFFRDADVIEILVPKWVEMTAKSSI